MAMSVLISLLSGVIMGLGLAISGMINPAKVLNFLDLAGDWDPTLVVVMASALVTTTVGYRLVFSRERPLFAAKYLLPTRRDIDAPLIAGAVLFGLGWGLAGFCPGPAIAALTSLRVEPFVFVAAMAAGMVIMKHFTHNHVPTPADSAKASP
jgi:uncharacterized membrane protein YedE/YeeE